MSIIALKDFFFQLDTSSKVSIMSVLVTIGSLIIAIRSNRISKRAVDIAEKTYQDSQSNFDIYYQNGWRIDVNDGKEKKRYLIVQMIIKNKSRTSDTFNCRMFFEFTRSDGSVGKAFSKHDPTLARLINRKDLIFCENNANINALSAESKWFVFEIPQLIIENYKIIKNEIMVSDLNDNSKLEEVVMIRKCIYDQNQK